MITAGIDCGARNTKAIVIRNSKIIGRGMVQTGFDQRQAAEASLAKAVAAAGITRDDIRHLSGTGAGRLAAAMPAESIDEILAMTRGARYFFPNARTVVDVGAEEGRAAKIDAQGKPVDFAVNERCAAGAGTFIETMARALEVSIEQMGSLSLQSDKKIPMNAQCVIFAESEVVSLIHAKTSRADISRAIHDAMAGRIASLIRQIGVNQDVVLLGGVGYSLGFITALQRELKVPTVHVPDMPEYGAAVGAAVVAADKS
jgi:benzoyl-CoA reductase subunit D